MGTLRISAIAVVDRNGRLVRGRDGLPGCTAKDRKRFKRLTEGQAIIMGKATYKKTFSNKFSPPWNAVTSVLTHDREFTARGCLVARSLVQAVTSLRQRGGIEEVLVVGGNSVYKEIWQYLDRLYLTVMDKETEGDVVFPDYQEEFPVVVKKKKGKSGTFYILERK